MDNDLSPKTLRHADECLGSSAEAADPANSAEGAGRSLDPGHFLARIRIHIFDMDC